MGQILSIIWNWVCPKPIGGSNNTNYNIPTHLINILDHRQPLIANNDDDRVFDQDSVVVTISSNLSSSSSSSSRISKRNGKNKICIGMYNSIQRILLVGEGDFSFSACLAIAFNTHAVNIVATSFNSREFLMKHYNNFPTNEVELKSRGCLVMHDIDARTMAKHPKLGMMKFDRIIFNFPHAGFVNNESSEDEIRRHQKLVRGFLKNAKKMIEEDGEIHVTHKSTPKFLKWDIPKLATDHGLQPLQAVNFKVSKYPGYHTKYGFGGDRDFECNPSKTYKFALSTKN